MIADLDTLLTALYVELTDRIIPVCGLSRSGPGRPPEVTDAELVCLAVAQVLLRYDDERYWLRAAAKQVGHLFPRLLRQSEYNDRVKSCAPLMEAALRWLADRTPGTAEMLRLMDATPSRAASPSSPRNARTCTAGPGTATAPAIPAGTGAASCCSSAPATGPSPDSGWPAPSCTANARKPASCSSTSPRTGPRPAPPSSPTRACPARKPKSSLPATTCA
jgi:hypothetical protein